MNVYATRNDTNGQSPRKARTTNRPPRVLVRPVEVTIEPETGGTFEVEVFNSSDIVEDFVLDVVGLDLRFVDVTVTPPRLNLFPSTSAIAQVTISVRTTYGLQAGRHLVAVRATPGSSRRNARTAELELQVVPVVQAVLGIYPHTAKAGRAAAFVSVGRNLGNVPLKLMLRATDQEGVVGFHIAPETLELPPGEEGWALVDARARRPVMGQSIDRSITVTGYYADADAEPLVTDAVFTQRPLLPNIVGTLVVLLLAAAILVGALLVADRLRSGNEDPPTDSAAAESPISDESLASPLSYTS